MPFNETSRIGSGTRARSDNDGAAEKAMEIEMPMERRRRAEAAATEPANREWGRAGSGAARCEWSPSGNDVSLWSGGERCRWSLKCYELFPGLSRAAVAWHFTIFRRVLLARLLYGSMRMLFTDRRSPICRHASKFKRECDNRLLWVAPVWGYALAW
jgi:hypothetical protein